MQKTHNALFYSFSPRSLRAEDSKVTRKCGANAHMSPMLARYARPARAINRFCPSQFRSRVRVLRT